MVVPSCFHEELFLTKRLPFGPYFSFCVMHPVLELGPFPGADRGLSFAVNTDVLFAFLLEFESLPLGERASEEAKPFLLESPLFLSRKKNFFFYRVTARAPLRGSRSLINNWRFSQRTLISFSPRGSSGRPVLDCLCVEFFSPDAE